MFFVRVMVRKVLCKGGEEEIVMFMEKVKMREEEDLL